MKSTFKPIKTKIGSKGKTTKAKANKQNTRHGKLDMPYTALNRFGGK